jgi:ATP-binding cassette subfamily B protein
VLIVSGYEILMGRMSFGDFMAFINAFWGTTAAVQNAFEKVPQLNIVLASMERIREFSAVKKRERSHSKDAIVKADRVSYSYDETNALLENINLEVQRGERILILGPNGSGKSTLASLMVGLLSPTSGSIVIPEPERVSAVLSPLSFLPGTLSQQIAFLPRDQQEQFHRLAARVKLLDHLTSNPDQLSAGQKKKFEVIWGLLRAADLYVFDEPLANVDAESKDIVFQTILRETRNAGLVIIMHDAFEYMRFFDKIVSLSEPHTAAVQTTTQEGVHYA